MRIMKDLPFCKLTWYALSKKAAFYWTVSPLYMCSLMVGYRTISVMQKEPSDPLLCWHDNCHLWDHPSGIANISSLNNVQKKHKVTYNSTLKTGIFVQGRWCLLIRAIIL